MERRIALTARATHEDRVLWEVERGRYRDLDDAAKRRIVGLARVLDAQAGIRAEIGKESEAREESARKHKDAVESIGSALLDMGSA